MKNVLVAKNFGWRKIIRSGYIFLIKGVIYNFSDQDLFKILITIKKNKIKSFLKKLDGHFSYILKKNSYIFFSVDRVSSIPLFYYHKNSEFLITDACSYFDKKKNIIKEQVLSLAMSGYTTGTQTMYQNFYRLKPGSFGFFNLKRSTIAINSYYQYQPWKINYKINYINLKEKLSKINYLIIKKVYNYSKIKQKKILIPLSAGNDSRLVASVLYELGAKNVVCLSYGRKNNYEALAAKKIAKKLKFKWIFLEISNNEINKMYNSRTFKKFRLKTGSFSASQDFSEFYVVQKITKIKSLSKALIVNGNSGDFISGGHIKYYNTRKKEKNNSLSPQMNGYIKKHYNLWPNLLTFKNKEIILKLLNNEIKQIKIKINKNNIHGIFEYLEFNDRQSKHVISKQRIYEYFGFEWVLPLFDNLYLDFWSQIPKKYKDNQKLYTQTLFQQNPGCVWKGNYWESLIKGSRISSKFLRFCIRPFFKSFFIFNKKRWHNFEKRYLYYFFDNLCLMGIQKYRDVITEKQLFRNAFSFDVRNFLKKIKFFNNHTDL